MIHKIGPAEQREPGRGMDGKGQGGQKRILNMIQYFLNLF